MTSNLTNELTVHSCCLIIYIKVFLSVKHYFIWDCNQIHFVLSMYPNLDSACSKQKLLMLMMPSCFGFLFFHRKQTVNGSSSRVFTVAVLFQSPQHPLLPAVTSCCQNFSDAETLDFFIIHSRSASFSSFNNVYFAKHLTKARVQCCILPRSPSGVAFGCFVADR